MFSRRQCIYCSHNYIFLFFFLVLRCSLAKFFDLIGSLIIALFQKSSCVTLFEDYVWGDLSILHIYSIVKTIKLDVLSLLTFYFYIIGVTFALKNCVFPNFIAFRSFSFKLNNCTILYFEFILSLSFF